MQQAKPNQRLSQTETADLVDYKPPTGQLGVCITGQLPVPLPILSEAIVTWLPVHCNALP